MITVLLVVHIIITIALVGIILMQKSEGGALGLGGGSRMGGLFTAKGAGNFLTKLTSILGITFFITSLTLAIIVARKERAENPSALIETSKPQEVGKSKVNKVPSREEKQETDNNVEVPLD